MLIHIMDSKSRITDNTLKFYNGGKTSVEKNIIGVLRYIVSVCQNNINFTIAEKNIFSKKKKHYPCLLIENSSLYVLR